MALYTFMVLVPPGPSEGWPRKPYMARTRYEDDGEENEEDEIIIVVLNFRNN